MGDRPRRAGPASTAPVSGLNSDPWHGQMISFSAGSYCTVQPAWGHTASKARNLPATGWSTIEGSSLPGAEKDAEPPTGTPLAMPIAWPAGWLVPRERSGWGRGELGDADGGDGGSGGAVLLPGPDVVPPAKRPRPAVRPPRIRPNAAVAVVRTALRRAASSRSACRCGKDLMRRAASADSTDPAPASSNGVQANTNTMSEPVQYGEEWKLTVRNSIS